jgi:glycerol uptake facilitator-like aquaporin
MTAFFVEAFGTGVLAFVVFALTHSKNDAQVNNVYIPPLIGLTVAALVSILVPLTQCGMDPELWPIFSRVGGSIRLVQL